MLSEPAAIPGTWVAPHRARRVDMPQSRTSGEERALAALAERILEEDERVRWRQLHAAKRRREWLFGRIAAKEAVLDLLLAERGIEADPRAVTILSDSWGRPVAGGSAVASAGLDCAVSIAHTDGTAMALAAATTAGVGLDLERTDRRRGAWEPAAFTAAERQVLDEASEGDRFDRALRLFCAKEAVAKALGRGLMGSPLNLRLAAADPSLASFDLEVTGRLEQALPERAGRPLRAWVELRDGLVVGAACASAVAADAAGPAAS
jgi:phosphopantetheinyl transferase